MVRVRTVGGTHMCDVAMGMFCVFPRELFGFFNRKKHSLRSLPTGNSVISRDEEESENCFRTGLSLSIKSDAIVNLRFSIMCALCVCACAWLLRWLAATAGCFLAWAL